MIRLRVGTRGSDLALWQTRWVSTKLREMHPGLTIEEVIIHTQGDRDISEPFGPEWPVGAFVTALEQALIAEKIDFAVHSYKDLPTSEESGLSIVAVPLREVVHDVLISRGVIDLDRLPSGFRVGTSSPRRIAQFLRHAPVQIVEIRGNIATRLSKIEKENLDGVVLAAAGLKRLGIEPKHATLLPTDRFVPSPAQGALAIQAKTGSAPVDLLAPLNDAHSLRCVQAERAFLRAVGAGCHTPVGALAWLVGNDISLHAQLFSDDKRQWAEGTLQGEEPATVGRQLADRLTTELRDTPCASG